MRWHFIGSMAYFFGQAIQSRIAGVAGIAAIAAGLVFLTSTAETPSLKAAAVQGGKLIDAPDLVGGTAWFNTDKPINLADLKGRIVLLDFWTLCCINCIHTLPDLAKLEARYPGVLVVIGIHSPKFENEKKTASVLKAVLRYEIKHPVINDADRKLWTAYGVNHWPTLVLIDPDGKVRGIAKGEGNYALAERDIKLLIKEYMAKGTLKKDPISFRLTDEKPAPLCFPGRVLADDASKRLFIADSTNHRIVITDLDGKKIAVAGSGKEGLKDGAFADAQFSDPQGMTLDGDTLYVADRKNHSIRALNLKTQTVKRVAGTGEKKTGWGGKTGTTTAARSATLSSPWDLLLVNKRIYIAMAGQNQIWTFDPAKETVSIYAGNGYEEIVDGALSKACFAQPSGLATDGKRLYVADSETSSIRSVPLLGNTGTVTTIVGKGLFDFGDVEGVGPQVRLQHALGVIHHDGKLYVADTYNSKIKVLDPNKRNCYTYVGGDNQFDEPGGLSIAAGKLYVADTNNHRIQVIDMKTRDVATLNLQGVDPVRRATSVGVSEKK
ncbi:MAG: redoxin domain-containing protein [Planctomycetes bacterium]|nr:redoxin domain-containing protein [Planctomycetota bacterium]